MKRALFSIIALGTFLILVFLAGCDEERLNPVKVASETPVDSLGSARLTIEEPVFDFGFTPQHAIVSHDFWLKSSGDDTLRIFQIKPG